jgi:signal transduction histidine kinase
VGIIGSVGIRSTTERGMVLTRARRDATSRTRVRFVGLIVGFAALATMTTAITAYVVAKAGIVTPAHSPFSIGVAIPLAPPFAVAALLGLGLTGALAWPIVGRILGTTGPTHVLEDVGHELRTPITIMRGHLELLRVDDQTEVNRTRTLLLGELDRMTRLVEDLKTLASAERPGFLEPTGVDVELLLDDVLDKARALGDRAWDVDARSEAVVFADGQRLTQALLELARNAVKVTSPGDTIAFGARVDAKTVRLWVRDTGPGVPDDDTSRIFRRSRRGTTRAPEGSGLGLAIVHAIARAHGGHVVLDSVPGSGARFTLVLPYLPAPHTATPRQASGRVVEETSVRRPRSSQPGVPRRDVRA